MEYVPSEDLQPVPGPKARSSDLVARLDSWDLVKVSESLNDARLLSLIMYVPLPPSVSLLEFLF